MFGGVAAFIVAFAISFFLSKVTTNWLGLVMAVLLSVVLTGPTVWMVTAMLGGILGARELAESLAWSVWTTPLGAVLAIAVRLHISGPKKPSQNN